MAQFPRAEADGGGVQETSGFFFQEDVTPDFKVQMRLDSLDYQTKSPFQDVKIIHTTQFGKTLVLDGKTQSAASDEHVYHEALVHPALVLHGNPKTVYIGGGGEMATAREILRFKSVEKCVMVDIDPVVCDVAFTHLQQWSEGVSKDDPRFELHVDDAMKFIKEDDRKYDAIIMDIADPIEAGPGIALYTQEFYAFVAKNRLNPGGVLVTQSGPGSHFNVKSECFTTIHSTLRSTFQHVYPYSVDIPSFGSNWGFNLATGVKSGDNSAEACLDKDVSYMLSKSTESIDEAISKNVNGQSKFYDGVTHMGMFGIPKDIRRDLKAETRIMTMDNPVFMH